MLGRMSKETYIKDVQGCAVYRGVGVGGHTYYMAYRDQSREEVIMGAATLDDIEAGIAKQLALHSGDILDVVDGLEFRVRRVDGTWQATVNLPEYADTVGTGDSPVEALDDASFEIGAKLIGDDV